MKVERSVCCCLLALGLFSGCADRRDPPLAKVGKIPIRQSEFQRKLSDVKPEYQNYVLTPNGRRQFLDVLIREKMILAASADAGVQGSPEFKREFGRLKAEEAERLAEGREYLMTQLWLEDLRRKGAISATDEEVRRHHQDHPVEVQLRHILLPSHEEAEAVIKKIRTGANFAALAKAKSLDAETAEEGGRMRPALYGEIIPELEDVAFRSRTGETVGPVRSKFGYHVLRKEAERRLPLSGAESRIRLVLEKQKLDRILQSFQARYPVEVHDVQFR